MATTTIAAQKLGKLPVRTDVRTLPIARYVDRAQLPEPPARLDLTAHVAEWPMYGNDRIGDCTIAAAAHMIESWTAAARGAAVEVTENAVLAEFERVRIGDGAIMLDVLVDWRKHGIGGHRVGAFARVPAYDHVLVRTAAWLFGGVYIGLELPLTVQGQGRWEWSGSLTGPAKPGSWGGHAVNIVRYDASSLTVVTWGRLLEMTWAFWDRYCDEAYCILSHDFLTESKAPNGFDVEALKQDLALVTA